MEAAQRLPNSSAFDSLAAPLPFRWRLLPFHNFHSTQAINSKLYTRLFLSTTSLLHSHPHTLWIYTNVISLWLSNSSPCCNRLTISAECPMKLVDFPMDGHACPLKFGSCKLCMCVCVCMRERVYGKSHTINLIKIFFLSWSPFLDFLLFLFCLFGVFFCSGVNSLSYHKEMKIKMPQDLLSTHWV